MMPISCRLWGAGALLLTSVLLMPVDNAHAQRVNARQQAVLDNLDQRMSAAEKRYTDALVLASNNDPKGLTESNAALEDMEDVIATCTRQRGCSPSTLLAAYKRLLKANVDNLGGTEEDTEWDGALTPTDEVYVSNTPRDNSGITNQRSFDEMVEFNPAVQASIRRWLTDMRPALMTSYENYQNLRPVMWPQWEQAGLPEALLFGIMAKESNGRTHARSRAGAAGLMQFMPATGSRFGLGPDGTGFDTRYEAINAAQASAAYINERMQELGGNVEYSLAGYNGGEGRARRIYNQFGGGSFWNEAAYKQWPAETQDYVPMVIAAAWIFQHAKQYGVQLPRVHNQPGTFRLAKNTTLYELTICMGSTNTREGYMRALRNLNPRYEADEWISAGTVLNGTSRMASLYQRQCVNGARADLARELVTANLNDAIIRAGTINVGAVEQVPAVEQPAVVRQQP